MIIAQISDTHLLEPRPGEASAARRLADLEATVAHIRRLDPLPDAVVHTGDVTHNAEPEEYLAARGALAGLGLPLIPIVGNRDRREPFLAAFAEETGLPPSSPFVQYAADVGRVRIVAGDTLSLSVPIGEFCTDRQTHLDLILQEAPECPTVLLLHHPPVEIPALRNPFQFASRAAAERVHDLIGRHRQIVRVLSGHTHRADTARIGHVSLSTAPSIATELRKDRYPEARQSAPVYQMHRIGPDGVVESRSELVPAPDR